MKLRIHNVKTEVVDCTDEEQSWLYHTLSYKDPKARFNRFKDSRIRQYEPTTGHFPGGLTRHVVEAAKANGMTVEIADARTRPAPLDAHADLKWLRWYQLEAVRACVTRTRGVVWSPTGSGKTEIAIGCTLAAPCKWLFLAHRGDLTEQAADRYHKRTGLGANMVDTAKRLEAGLNIATFQMFWARMRKRDPLTLRLLGEAEGLLIDECHIMPATSFAHVANGAANAFYRLGLSGTPTQGNKKMLVHAALGPVIYHIKTQTLIDSGVLANPTVRMLECHQTIELPPAKNNRALAKLWDLVNKTLVIHSAERNGLLLKAIKAAKKPALVFVSQIDQGKNLHRMVADAGIPVEFVNGSKNVQQRKAAIKRLEYGERDVLVCTGIFNEGVDIPALESVVIGSGGASIIQALQRIGRGSRTNDGKKATFEVWDIRDVGSLLENHSKERSKAYETEGYEVLETTL